VLVLICVLVAPPDYAKQLSPTCLLLHSDTF